MWSECARFKPEHANIFSMVNYTNKKIIIIIIKKFKLGGSIQLPEHKEMPP